MVRRFRGHRYAIIAAIAVEIFLGLSDSANLTFLAVIDIVSLLRTAFPQVSFCAEVQRKFSKTGAARSAGWDVLGVAEMAVDERGCKAVDFVA